jgi:hypothetical protein
MFDWHVLIPVVWAIVSSALALVLYKTSSALFEQKTDVQRLQLVGSIVIAGAIFGALRWATPTSLVTGTPRDSVIVSKKSLAAIASTIQETKNAIDRLSACTAIAPPQECRAEMEVLRRLVDSLGETLP